MAHKKLEIGKRYDISSNQDRSITAIFKGYDEDEDVVFDNVQGDDSYMKNNDGSVSFYNLPDDESEFKPIY